MLFSAFKWFALGRGVVKGLTMSKEEAEQLRKRLDIERFVNHIMSTHTIPARFHNSIYGYNAWRIEWEPRQLTAREKAEKLWEDVIDYYSKLGPFNSRFAIMPVNGMRVTEIHYDEIKAIPPHANCRCS